MSEALFSAQNLAFAGGGFLFSQLWAYWWKEIDRFHLKRNVLLSLRECAMESLSILETIEMHFAHAEVAPQVSTLTDHFSVLLSVDPHVLVEDPKLFTTVLMCDQNWKSLAARMDRLHASEVTGALTQGYRDEVVVLKAFAGHAYVDFEHTLDVLEQRLKSHTMLGMLKRRVTNAFGRPPSDPRHHGVRRSKQDPESL